MTVHGPEQGQLLPFISLVKSVDCLNRRCRSAHNRNRNNRDGARLGARRGDDRGKLGTLLSIRRQVWVMESSWGIDVTLWRKGDEVWISSSVDAEWRLKT